MAGDTTKDMTQGSPMKLILGFSIPLLFGFLFQQFYNVMDTIIVGRVLGVTEKEVISEQVVTYDEFFDYWILHGRMQRICNSFGA